MKRFFAMMLAMTMMGTTVYAAEKRDKVTAIPVRQEIVFDGNETVLMGYNINGNTYFRLREVALNITEHIDSRKHHFHVYYDNDLKSIDLITNLNFVPIVYNKDYTVGTEIKEGIRSDARMTVNGTVLDSDQIKGYVIDGYTFCKLRDLAIIADLDVEWCEEERVIEVTGEERPTVDENGNPIVYRKPAIYLYPEETTDVSVELEYEGDLTVTYPAYNDGWKVTAEPDGTLINHADGREYSYLFWEGEGYGDMDFSEGFVVKGEDTVSFLQDKLSEMGMTSREYNEFIVYWLPYMQDNAYNLISFQWENYNESAKLHITPEPDNMLRVFMAFKTIDEPIEISEQKLPVLEREGFTVVEWGGAEVY